MTAATTVRLARLRAGLSKRELARRAGTSPAAIVAYESGAREPSLPTLQRIVEAAGARAEITLTRPRARRDPHDLARELLDVLALAEVLPKRPQRKQLGYPPLRR